LKAITSNVNIFPALNSMTLFRNELKKIPKLTAEEEIELARRWRDHSDLHAIQQLIMSNLYIILGILKDYSHFNLAAEDLLQEGTLGLMHAAKKFDPERGFRLKTYASWWIRASIHDYILRNWSIVKMGTNKLQRQIFAGLHKAEHAIAALEGRDLDEVSESYGTTEKKFQSIAGSFLQRDMPIHALNDDGIPIFHALPAPGPGPEEIAVEKDWEEHQHSMLKDGMSALRERDRYIIEQRHLLEDGKTLKDLSEELGISIERVRQLESRAMKKLKETMQEEKESSD